MRTSVTGQRNNGFSLIEVLVVVVVVAVLAGAVIINANFSSLDSQAQREMDRFAALLNLQCEEAILQRREMGIHLSDTSYLFSAWENQRWIPIERGVFRQRELQEGLSVTLLLEGRQTELPQDFPEVPQLVCFGSGESIPFTMGMTADPQGTIYWLRGDGLGGAEQSTETNQ